MKKILYLPALLFSGISLAQSGSSPSISIDDNGLGKQFPDCLLSGSICKLFPTNQDPKSSNANAYKTGESSFCIGIKKTAMTEDKQVALLGKALKNVNPGDAITFRIPASYTVEHYFLKAINLSTAKDIVAAGSYPVEINSEYVLIKLTLSGN